MERRHLYRLKVINNYMYVFNGQSTSAPPQCNALVYTSFHLKSSAIQLEFLNWNSVYFESRMLTNTMGDKSPCYCCIIWHLFADRKALHGIQEFSQIPITDVQKPIENILHGHLNLK